MFFVCLLSHKEILGFKAQRLENKASGERNERRNQEVVKAKLINREEGRNDDQWAQVIADFRKPDEYDIIMGEIKIPEI